jgi:hypothetical protein
MAVVKLVFSIPFLNVPLMQGYSSRLQEEMYISEGFSNCIQSEHLANNPVIYHESVNF